MEHCINHPDKKALSVCHGCGKYYCKSCLDKGKEFYFDTPSCQGVLKKEVGVEPLSSKMTCPVYLSEL